MVFPLPASPSTLMTEFKLAKTSGNITGSCTGLVMDFKAKDRSQSSHWSVARQGRDLKQRHVAERSTGIDFSQVLTQALCLLKPLGFALGHLCGEKQGGTVTNRYSYYPHTRDFPGSLVVDPPHFHCRGAGAAPGWGANIPHAV